MDDMRSEPVVRDGIMILPLVATGETAATGQPAGLDALEVLAGAYLDGVRRVLALEGLTRPAWRDAAQAFNALLTSRGMPRMLLRDVDARSEAARAVRDIFSDIAAADRRRRFLRSATRVAENGEETRLATVQARHADRSGALFAAAPAIDPMRCTGCDGCIRVCPAGVLTLIKDGSGDSVYVVDAAACDGCGLCVDVCPASAIGVSNLATSPGEIALKSWTCPSCGVEAHVPQVRDNGDGLCDTCARTGHHKKLFQVLP